MKIIRFAMLAFIVAAGCDIPQRPVSEGNVTGSFFTELFGKRCSAEILFGSYAGGIDDESYGEIKNLLSARGGQLTTKEKPWGREGEKAICVDIASASAADRLVQEVAAIIAAHEPTKGPVTVTRGPPLP